MKKVLSIILTVVMLLSTLSVFSVLSVSAANIGDGSGAAADKPAGSGTQNDPYLIATFGNLKWIQQEIHNADEYYHWMYEESDPRYHGSNGTFAGVYFEQICDIDMEKGSMNSIGGYFYDKDLNPDGESDSENNGHPALAYKKKPGQNYYAAFSGNYNGNGYTIKNGTINGYTSDSQGTMNWSCGLFGMIYGATIRNIVLDNVTINSNLMVTGAVVGIAHAPLSGTDAGKSNFNVIENCVVKNTCTMNPTLPGGNGGYSENYYRGSVGGVVGRAWGTTVRGCVNEMNMTISGKVGIAGGVVGVAECSVVEYCVNKGSMTISDRNGMVKTGKESSFGGVVGYVPGKTQGWQHWTKYNTPGCTIRHCYNAATGSFSHPWDNTPGSGVYYWGGVLGAFTMMLLPASGESDPNLYLVENCYNLYGYTFTTSGAGNNKRVAGVIGFIYADKTTGYNEVTVKNSASVAVSANSYSGNGQIRWHGNIASGNLLTQTNVTEQTADNLKDEIAAIDATVTKMHTRGTDKVTAIGDQLALDGSTYRLVLGINSTRWYAIGAEVSLTVDGQAANKVADKSDDVVYNAVEGKVDGVTKTWTADDLYVGYLSTLDISDVAASGVSVYTIKTYVKDQDDAHTKIYGDVIVVTFENGVFKNAELNPTQS